MGKTFRRHSSDDEYDFKRRKKFEHRRNKRLDNYNKKFGNAPVDDAEKMKEEENAQLYNKT